MFVEVGRFLLAFGQGTGKGAVGALEVVDLGLCLHEGSIVLLSGNLKRSRSADVNANSNFTPTP